MEFKTEVGLLSLALSLFVISAFFYSCQTGSLSWATNAYQGFSFWLVGAGSVLTMAAFVSYTKHNKNAFADTFDFSMDDKSNE